MNQRTNKVFAIVRAKQQQHHIGKTITTSIFGRMVEGKIIAVILSELLTSKHLVDAIESQESI